MGKPRRIPTLLSMAVSILSAASLAGLASFIAAHYPARLQLSPHHRYELSPDTLAVLERLESEVEVVIYSRRDEPTGLRSSIELLLEEYALRCPLLRLRQVDYLRDRAAADALARSHGLESRPDSDTVIFASGGRSRRIAFGELRELQVADRVQQALGRREVREVGFRGEQLFTSALWHLSAGTSPRVALVQGHGEHHPEQEYSQLVRALEERNFQVEPLDRLSSLEGYSMALIAGPRSPYSPQEIEALDAYLRGGGRLLLLLGHRSAGQADRLEAWLRRWGVRMGSAPVEDEPQRMGTGIAVTEFADHPLTAPLVEKGVGVQLTLPRSAGILPGTARSLPGWKGIPVAFTSRRGLTRGFRGPVPLAAAVEVERAQGPAARILAVGSSRFLADDRIGSLANRDFGVLAAGWLAGETALIQGIGPQPIHRFRLALTGEEFRRLAWLMLGIGPGSVILLGTGVWFYRRI